MDLTLDASVAEGFSSRSQIARIITEQWAENNFYCLGCSSEEVLPNRPGTPVHDFRCASCQARYQLKSKNGRHGRVIVNSAYYPKIQAIRQGTAPNYAFLDYDRDRLKVTNLFVVPGHFITESIVQQRPPLPPTARRAGWIGSNLLLAKLPPEGKVRLVTDSYVEDPNIVRLTWNKFSFLKSDHRALQGWGAEVLAAVRELQTITRNNRFTLKAFYSMFGEYLSSLHPENHHVNAKIRQQLQLLRDHGILEFLGSGRYRIIG